MTVGKSMWNVGRAWWRWKTAGVTRSDGFLQIWGLPSMGVPEYPNSWMIYFMENPIEMNDDWGYPHFKKPPYGGYTDIPVYN